MLRPLSSNPSSSSFEVSDARRFRFEVPIELCDPASRPISNYLVGHTDMYGAVVVAPNHGEGQVRPDERPGLRTRVGPREMSKGKYVPRL